jgi:hypothetical protein
MLFKYVLMIVCRYDAGGKDGVDEAPKMDPGALYAMIFGSEKFEPIIGELQLASQMQSQVEDNQVGLWMKY